jgi:hypothetical protein
MEDPMGFERHTISSTKAPVSAKLPRTSPREAAPVVKPLRPVDATRDVDALRLARQMRSEWRKERYSRLAGN